nr:electron transport complex subunit RsxC [Bisgaardia hudsonensis]
MDILTSYNSGKLWDFKGGIHPPEMKSQSNQQPIKYAKLVNTYYIPVKQHVGISGNLLVKTGDKVLKGQQLTLGDGLRALPVHAPTSGVVTNIIPYIAAHPSGLPEISIEIQADGLDQWREKQPIEDFLTSSPEKLIDRIYQAGIAGLGGAVFPTAAKIQSAEKKVKLLIINGAECEPYITCDDRLMRDYADEIIEGIRILRYILRPEKAVIAIEDNKPEAIKALKKALSGANDIDIRVIPTKYPSGASKQLIQILTGIEVPNGQRSSSIGVLMHNVGTAFAIKRAVINDEPLIERVVTLTGDKIHHKGNQWVRIGTPIIQLLAQVNYQYDDRFPVFMGGPMMGFIIPNLNAPVTKVTNCLLAPDHFEYAPPEPEQSCIRCSACSDVCPVNLMPQQLYWFARSEDHEKSEQYALKDCMECGLCAYVCPSHIPLIQYFRQEKAKIWEIKDKAKKAEEAKIRFEARQARLEKEEQARKERTQRAAEARREEIAKQQGVDPVQAALARLKAKKQDSKINEVKTIITESGEKLPDNSAIMAERKARRLAKQATQQSETDKNLTALNHTNNTQKISVAAAIAKAKAKKLAQQESQHTEEVEVKSTESVEKDPKKAAVVAAIARAKAKKLAQQESQHTEEVEIKSTEPVEKDPKKVAVATAIARVKAKKLAQQESLHTEEVEVKSTESVEKDPKKVAVTAAIARAKAKKLAQQESQHTEEIEVKSTESVEKDPKKAAVMAAIARAKAKKLAQQESQHTEEVEIKSTEPVEKDPKKAAVAAAIARAKAKKLAQQESQHTEEVEVKSTEPVEKDPKKAAVMAAIARAKAKKLAQQESQHTEEVEIKSTEPVEKDPKKAAVAAAIARAKAKKLAQQQEKKI